MLGGNWVYEAPLEANIIFNLLQRTICGLYDAESMNCVRNQSISI